MATKEKSKGFIWFDRPEEGRRGFLSGLGGGLSGFAAPFLGDTQWLQRQQQMEAEQQKFTQDQEAKQAFLNALNGGQLNPQSPTNGLNAPMSSSTINPTAQYIQVPDYNSPVGFRLELNPFYKTEQESKIRGEAKSKEATIKASSAFGRVASAVKIFSDYYKGALDEGGVGGLIAHQKGKFITGKLGGSLGEQMTATGKLYGQRAELALSMVPILTNQNRFMTSIMDYINQSLPMGHEGANLAEGKLEQTLLNQFSTTKVLTKLGYNPENPDDVSKIDNMDDKEASNLAGKVISLSKVYKLTDAEQKEFNEIKKDVLGSLIDYKPKTSKKSFKNLWE